MLQQQNVVAAASVWFELNKIESYKKICGIYQGIIRTNAGILLDIIETILKLSWVQWPRVLCGNKMVCGSAVVEPSLR